MGRGFSIKIHAVVDGAINWAIDQRIARSRGALIHAAILEYLLRIETMHPAMAVALSNVHVNRRHRSPSLQARANDGQLAEKVERNVFAATRAAAAISKPAIPAAPEPPIASVPTADRELGTNGTTAEYDPYSPENGGKENKFKKKPKSGSGTKSLAKRLAQFKETLELHEQEKGKKTPIRKGDKGRKNPGRSKKPSNPTRSKGR